MPDSAPMVVRPFDAGDESAVMELFVRVNRGLATPSQEAAIEAYVVRSIREEIGRIEAYYGEHGGAFFVADRGARLVGMYGLEAVGEDAVELRRMYVDPDVRRQGIARALLTHAEATARAMERRIMVLSTSELQQAALSLYRSSGFLETGEAVALAQSNKVLGGGLRRYHFEKVL